MLRRALEKVPRKGKMFDPAESGGHNLLEEMSLLELRQRLAYTQQRLLVRLLLLSSPLPFALPVNLLQSLCYFTTTWIRKLLQYEPYCRAKP